VYFCVLQLSFEDRRPKKYRKILTPLGMYSCIVYQLNFFKIDAIHGARRYAARACGACVTRNAQFTFQTFLRLTLSGIHSLPVKLFLRLTRFTVHDNTQRAPAALACVTKDAYFAFQLFFSVTILTSETIH
jgi:hypothetical protein